VRPLPACTLGAHGLAWRYAEELDLKFIVYSWKASFESHFISGDGTSPLDQRHAKVIEEQRRLLPDVKARRLLLRVYHGDMSLLVAHLVVKAFSDPEAPKPVVVYDPENPEFIMAWGLADDLGEVAFIYVKQAFRRQGLGTALLEALAGPEAILPRSLFMTPAGLKLVQAQARG
jgi:ribosomal protein S18 acetylase RimI-like enzyme